MRKIRLLSMASTCILAAGLTISANAAISESYSLDTHSGEHLTRTSQRVAATKLVSDEVLLLGSAVIGLIGITIMRKTMH